MMNFEMVVKDVNTMASKLDYAFTESGGYKLSKMIEDMLAAGSESYKYKIIVDFIYNHLNINIPISMQSEKLFEHVLDSLKDEYKKRESANRMLNKIDVFFIKTINELRESTGLSHDTLLSLLKKSVKTYIKDID